MINKNGDNYFINHMLKDKATGRTEDLVDSKSIYKK
jgi:hypothetical protein